ncbi:unnamed protein product [Diplocarpon coronariae]
MARYSPGRYHGAEGAWNLLSQKTYQRTIAPKCHDQFPRPRRFEEATGALGPPWAPNTRGGWSSTPDGPQQPGSGTEHVILLHKSDAFPEPFGSMSLRMSPPPDIFSCPVSCGLARQVAREIVAMHIQGDMSAKLRLATNAHGVALLDGPSSDFKHHTSLTARDMDIGRGDLKPKDMQAQQSPVLVVSLPSDGSSRESSLARDKSTADELRDDLFADMRASAIHLQYKLLRLRLSSPGTPADQPSSRGAFATAISKQSVGFLAGRFQ